MLIVRVSRKAVKRKTGCGEEHTASQQYLFLALLPGFIKRECLNGTFNMQILYGLSATTLHNLWGTVHIDWSCIFLPGSSANSYKEFHNSERY